MSNLISTVNPKKSSQLFVTISNFFFYEKLHLSKTNRVLSFLPKHYNFVVLKTIFENS